MSFENGVFLPDPEHDLPTPATSVRGGGSSGSSRGRGRNRGGRQQPQSEVNKVNNGPTPRLPSLMGDYHHLEAGNRGRNEGQRETEARFGFAFNPDAPSFQPLSGGGGGGQEQQQPHNYQSTGGGPRGQSRGHHHKQPSGPVQFNAKSTRGRSGDSSPRSRNKADKSSRNRRRDHDHNSNSDSEGSEVTNSRSRSTPKTSELTTSKQQLQLTPTSPRSQKPDIRNQRERLSDQLGRNAYDCMICVERIRRIGTIWSCSKCFNVFHLRCVSTWANSSKDEVGWRCPGCQSYYEDIPNEYRCFCGRVKNPEPVRSDVPHSCGGVCGKMGSGGPDCDHPCGLLCHPGPCPPCEAIQTKKCCCGKISAQVKCSSKAILTCASVCDKSLNCGSHTCSKPCHGGDCDPCAFIIQLECHCKSEKKELICDENSSGIFTYSCDRTCDKLLSCQNHNCPDKCHPGPCGCCSLSPEVVLRCPCGQTGVAEACLRCGLPPRRKCLDPIPVCGKICGKSLPCGGGSQHKCSASCHTSPKCPTCPLLTNFKCRCGNKNFELSCAQYDPEKEYRCEKRCSKKKSCGRHKCNAKCCVDEDHICLIVCDRPLRCGHHNCQVLCHNGHCPPCRVVSFHELACECGASVIYPPVPCGTRRPPCTSPCGREHDCDHPVMHHCHSDVHCPPCTMLTEKWCHGKHVLRKNVMCHIKQVSCGMPCKRLLSCGRHHCTRACHPDECLPRGKSCQMTCTIPKPICGHVCGAPCHPGPCPDDANAKCKVVSEVACPCGRQTATMPCWKREKEYERLVCYLTNLELKRLRNAQFDEDKTSSGGTETEKEIDADAILSSFQAKTPKANVLECDKECARVERNRKMVAALQIEDPDATSTFGTPNYSEFLTAFAKKNPQFVENVHDRLTALVVKAKRSKRKNETYGFESMNRDKRRVVHEYSDHFGCLSESFDEEPNRNVICTGSKEKSYLPAVSLVDAVFRPNMCSGRKSAFKDVEITQNTKSQIMRPANGKMWSNPSNSPSNITGMVPLVPATTLPPNANFNFMQNSNANYTPATRNPSFNSTNSTSRPMPSLPGADFPPLS